jgi:hypothetical protein
MNRAPGKGDTWWARHQADCGGAYTKIQEPAPTKKQLEAMSSRDRAGRQKNKLDNWIKPSAKRELPIEGDTSDKPVDVEKQDKTSARALNGARKAETLVVEDFIQSSTSTAGSGRGQKRPRTDLEDDSIPHIEKKVLVECPICTLRIAESDINAHLDAVHP